MKKKKLDRKTFLSEVKKHHAECTCAYHLYSQEALIFDKEHQPVEIKKKGKKHVAVR